jgi:hypothetical protein
MIMADTCCIRPSMKSSGTKYASPEKLRLRSGSDEIGKKHCMSDTVEGGHRREQTVKVMFRRG